MRKIIFATLQLLWVLLPSVLTAQKVLPPPPKSETLFFADSVRNFEKQTELGLVLGGFYYLGDLTRNNIPSFADLQPGGGIYVRRHLWPNLAVKGNLLTGKISSRDIAYPERDFSFDATVHEFSGQLEWDIFGKRRLRRVDTVVYELDRYTQYAMVNVFKRVLLPYVFVGGGGFMTKTNTVYNYPYAESAGQSQDVEADKKNSKGALTNFGITTGGGVNLDLSRRWIIGIEVGARNGFTDYFDGISLSGGPKYNDWYWFGGLHVGYRFGIHDIDNDGTPDAQDKCPEIPGIGRTHGCPDADNDGISDKEDECPRIAGILSLAGCPMKDMDNDGVQDIDDLCPTVAGKPEFKGCPDTDNDGIEDKLDTCVTVAGIAKFNGCPDTDEDGIEDRKDACPKEKGDWDYYHGCPVRDSDKDGVEDKIDLCVELPGKAEFIGCPDTDNDGVEDKLDICPTTPGKKENNGCPVVEKKDLERLKFAVKAVKFETGKAILKPESNKILDEIVAIMGKYPDYLLKIEGHTDNVGKDASNQLLSEQRAKACLDYIVSKGVNAKRIQSVGYGETKPIADNKTAAGKAANRRVEFNLDLPEKK